MFIIIINNEFILRLKTFQGHFTKLHIIQTHS